jgi:hypothetical protein
MAHDNQVPNEPETSSGSSSPIAKVNASLGVLADWWALYTQIYRDDPTEELAVAFREILKPLLSRPEILNEALIVAARQSPDFRPKPGRIFEIAEGLMQRAQWRNRPKYLDEPKLSEAERLAELESPEYQALKKKVKGA